MSLEVLYSIQAGNESDQDAKWDCHTGRTFFPKVEKVCERFLVEGSSASWCSRGGGSGWWRRRKWLRAEEEKMSDRGGGNGWPRRRKWLTEEKEMADRGGGDGWQRRKWYSREGNGWLKFGLKDSNVSQQPSCRAVISQELCKPPIHPYVCTT